MTNAVRPEPCSLYIHIPFCLRKCTYCDFVSYKVNAHDTSRYCSAVAREIELVFGEGHRVSRRDDGLSVLASAEGLQPTTVYIGGGTPTVLPIDELAVVIDAARRAAIRFPEDPDHDIEFTVEANPGTLSAGYLSRLRQLGVNRLSIGLQSTSDKHLSMLGRIHSYSDFLESYRLAVLSGFSNISIDLIYGLPGQTFEEWHEDISRVIELAPSHVSCYALTLAEGTALFNEVRCCRLTEPQEDLVADMHFDAVSMLTEAGYGHYEISNYARPGMECKHNLNYWSNGYYAGVGVAAHAHLRGIRCANTADVETYLNRVEQGIIRPDHVEPISPKRQLSDSFILGLRTARGVDTRALASRFGDATVSEFARRLGRFLGTGLVEFSHENIRLTEQGMILSNEILSELL